MNRFSLTPFRLIFIGLMIAGLAGVANGQISLYSTGVQNTFEVGTTLGSNPATVHTGFIGHLPLSTNFSIVGSLASSTTSLAFTTSSLGTTFNQSASNSTATSGGSTIYFTATSFDSYTISGTENLVGGTHTGDEFAASLYDVTAGSYVYQYDLFQSGSGSVSSSLDSTGGALSGTLFGGHVYEFQTSDSLQENDTQALSGTTTLKLSVLAPIPEPSTWAILLVGAGMFTGFKCFGRKSKTSTQ